MNRILCKQYLLLLICMALLLPGQLPAQNGLYVGTDLGIAIAPALDLATTPLEAADGNLFDAWSSAPAVDRDD